MDSKGWMDDARHLWKSSSKQLGLIALALAGVAGLYAFFGGMSAITMLGSTVIALGVLLLVIRRRGGDAPAAEPKTAFGRWLSEVRRVWLASHWDLGLIAAASAGVWMLIAYAMETYFPSHLDADPLAVVAAVAIAWVYGSAHLLANHNTEHGTSTPLKTVATEAGFRFGTVVVGVLLYAAVAHLGFIYDLLGVPASMDIPIAMAGGLVTGALLPYVSILMVERKNPIQALQRNIDLVSGRWGLMFVCLVLTWVAFFTAGLAAGSLVIAAIHTVDILTPMLVSTTAASVALLGVKGILVGAWVLLIFYSLPVFVVFPVATYRMLVKDKGQEAGAAATRKAQGAEVAEGAVA